MGAINFDQKTARLAWTGIFAFLILNLGALVYTSCVEPARAGSLLMSLKSDGKLGLSDFVPFYYGGLIARSDKRYEVYTPSVRLMMSNKVVAPNIVDQPLYCGYLPIVFPLLIPFSILPLIPAYFLWCATTITFGVTSIIIVAKKLVQWKPTRIALLLLISLASFPSIWTLRLGQVMWFVVGLLALYSWGLFKNRDVLAGITLALTMVKPQYTVFLALPAIAGKRFRLIAIALFSELFLFLLAASVIGVNNILHFPQLLHQTEYIDTQVPWMINIRPLFLCFTDTGHALTYSFWAMWSAAAVLLAVWWGARNQNERSKRWLLAVTIVASLIFSPHTHSHDLLLLIPAALVTFSFLEFKQFREPSEFKNGKIQIAYWSWAVVLTALSILGYLLLFVVPIGSMYRWPFFAYDLLLLFLCSWSYVMTVKVHKSKY